MDIEGEGGGWGWGGGGYLALNALVAPGDVCRRFGRFLLCGVPRRVLGNGTALGAVPLPRALDL